MAADERIRVPTDTVFHATIIIVRFLCHSHPSHSSSSSHRRNIPSIHKWCLSHTLNVRFISFIFNTSATRTWNLEFESRKRYFSVCFPRCRRWTCATCFILRLEVFFLSSPVYNTLYPLSLTIEADRLLPPLLFFFRFCLHFPYIFF